MSSDMVHFFYTLKGHDDSVCLKFMQTLMKFYLQCFILCVNYRNVDIMSSTSTLNSTSSTMTGGIGTGFFPPFTSSNDAENQKMQERIKELEKENYELTKQLQSTVAQTRRTLEQIVDLQDSNDRLKMRINQVKDFVGWAISAYFFSDSKLL